MRTIHTERIHVGTQYAFKRIPAIGEGVDSDDLEAIAAGGITEGDYTTWTRLWTVPLTDIMGPSDFPMNFIFDDLNEVAALAPSTYYSTATIPIIDLNTGAVVSPYTTGDGALTNIGYYRQSAFGRYALLAVDDTTYPDVLIIKANKTHVQVPLTGGEYVNATGGVICASISTTGKWILVFARGSDPVYDVIICFKGS